MRIETSVLVTKYQKNLFAAAFNICKNVQDAEDAVQECLLEYHTGKKEFESEEHIKAWLLRVVINQSKNRVTDFWHRRKTSWEDYMGEVLQAEPKSSELLTTVMQLPEKYRIVIHLYYYEEYSVRQIAEILQMSESSIKKRLSRGRMILKDKLKEEWADE